MSFTILSIFIVLVTAAFVGLIIHYSRRGGRPRAAGRASKMAEPPAATSQTPRTPVVQASASMGRTNGMPNLSGSVLNGTNGSRANRAYPIPSVGLRIGRNPNNTIVLDEPLVSRQHAEVVERDGAYWVRDLGSTNGTFVDGVRVFERILQPGNRIRVGLSEFVFNPVGATVPAATQPALHSRLPETPASGRRFEGYMLGDLIGGGGMAQVYRAVAPDGHTVAIKVPTIANDPYLMRKFVREGDAIGRLLRGHPNIVQVEHFGFSDQDQPYIVMEYVDGGSLRDRGRQPFAQEDIRRVVGQTCLALGFAHQHQIVHRDVKPENILLTAAGQVKVADFGIARELSGFTVTHNGPIGTPEYMSPEQARGDNVQPASDVYAAGVVLYELLTGRVPFPGRPTISDDVQRALDVVERHISESPTPPRTLAPDASTELATVAMKALEKKPSRRFKDGAAMASALGMEPSRGVARTSEPVGRLVVTEGPARGQVFDITGDLFELGRQRLDPTNMAISRHHAILRRRGSEFWLEDISVNGTWVNNVRVRGEQMLSRGDCIRIGTSVLRLEA
jgi:serine/threonine protein kinase